MEIRHEYTGKMDLLNREIIKMGILVEEAIGKAMECLIDRDEEKVRSVILEDNEINTMELEIEDFCIDLIAREQPVAGDLRRLITALKVSTQLERIGDHAVHVAKGALRLSEEQEPIPLFELPKMAELAISMLRGVLKAYIENDPHEARHIASLDDEMDRIHDYVIQEVFSMLMDTKPGQRKATTLLFIDRFLERMGDHITNICEWIIYSVTGIHEDLDH
jgi:phosphate transport system protein